MKILIDARMVSQKPHGIARYVIDLVQELAIMGHQMSALVSAKDSVELLGRECVHSSIVCRTSFANPLEILELTARTRGFSMGRKTDSAFDVIHFPSFAVPLLMPQNSVVTIHDLIHLKGEPRLAHELYYRTVVRRALNTCGRVIAVSDWTKKDLVATLGVAANKIDVVRNGVGVSQTSVTPLDHAKKSAVVGTIPLVLCVSNTKTHKNVVTLLRACESLWDTGLPLTLGLALGGGGLPASWSIRDRDLNNILQLKNLSNEELNGYIKLARVLVSPARWEGFNYPAADALVLGTEVLLSRGSAHDEFKSNLLHFYEPSHDARAMAESLRRILTTERHRHLTENHTPTTKKLLLTPAMHSKPVVHNVFSRRQMAEATLEVYQKLSPSAF